MCKHASTLCVHLASNLACPVRFLRAKEPKSILYSSFLVCEITYQACLLVYDFPQCICKVLLLNTFCSINCSVKWGCEGIGKALQIFKHMTFNNTIPTLWHIPMYQMEKLRQTGGTLIQSFQRLNPATEHMFPDSFSYTRFLELP